MISNEIYQPGGTSFIRTATVRGKNKWCGPAILSTLLNVPTETASRLIRAQSGQRAVRSTKVLYLRRALHEAGLATSYAARFPKDGPMLRYFVKCLPVGTYVVIVTGHGVTVQVTPRGAFVIDNVQHNGIAAAAAWCARKRVQLAFTVHRSTFANRFGRERDRLVAEASERKREQLRSVLRAQGVPQERWPRSLREVR